NSLVNFGVQFGGAFHHQEFQLLFGFHLQLFDLALTNLAMMGEQYRQINDGKYHGEDHDKAEYIPKYVHLRREYPNSQIGHTELATGHNKVALNPAHSMIEPLGFLRGKIASESERGDRFVEVLQT